MSVPPASLVALASRVENRIADILAPEESRWSNFDEDLTSPVAEIRRLVASGGKRLRPAFCHWGFVGAGGDPDSMISLDAGAALELLHGFALFHDDVMDGSTSRRGAPVTHEVFADEHRRGGSSGESRRYGDGIAILVGDLAFVYSDRLMSDVSAEAREIWHELRIELNIGQLLDLIGSARNERRRFKAERICRYKSGKYTIERPLHLGALLANPACGNGHLAALSRYGLPLGDAFQMRDDVLGAFGETQVTGKPVGDDLREGKPTPLMAIAVSRSNPSQKKILDLVGSVSLSDAQVEQVQDVIRDTGALDELEAHISALTDEAIAALDRAELTDEAKKELVTLANYVSWRVV